MDNHYNAKIRSDKNALFSPSMSPPTYHNYNMNNNNMAQVLQQHLAVQKFQKQLQCQEQQFSDKVLNTNNNGKIAIILRFS